MTETISTKEKCHNNEEKTKWTQELQATQYIINAIEVNVHLKIEITSFFYHFCLTV